MGKDQNGKFVYGLINAESVKKLRTVDSMNAADKTRVGLDMLEELTGINTAGMKHGEPDLKILNQALKIVYLGNKSMNESGDSVTKENWKDVMGKLAEDMSLYLSPRGEKRQVKLGDASSINVASKGILHGVKIFCNTTEEQRQWLYFNIHADDEARNARPSMRDQIFRLGDVLGQDRDNPKPYVEEMANDIRTSFFDNQGHFSPDKMKEFLDASTEWLYQSELRIGQEIERCQKKLEAQHIDRTDTDGKSKLYSQADDRKFTTAQCFAIDAVEKNGFSYQANTKFRSLLLQPFTSFGGTDEWKEFLKSQNLDENTELSDYLNDKIKEVRENHLKTAGDAEKYHSTLAIYCYQGNHTELEPDAAEKKVLDPILEEMKTEKDRLGAYKENMGEIGYVFMNPRKQEAFRQNINDLRKLGEQLKLADSWYHRNSGEYKDLVAAVDHLNESWESVTRNHANEKLPAGKKFDLTEWDMHIMSDAFKDLEQCAHAYVADKAKARSTDLGADRYAIAMDMLSKVSWKKAEQDIQSHNDYREAHGSRKVISLKDLQDRTTAHAEKHENKLSQRLAVPHVEQNKAKRRSM